jgi:hypothetical protein
VFFAVFLISVIKKIGKVGLKFDKWFWSAIYTCNLYRGRKHFPNQDWKSRTFDSPPVACPSTYGTGNNVGMNIIVIISLCDHETYISLACPVP